MCLGIGDLAENHGACSLPDSRVKRLVTCRALGHVLGSVQANTCDPAQGQAKETHEEQGHWGSELELYGARTYLILCGVRGEGYKL